MIFEKSYFVAGRGYGICFVVLDVHLSFWNSKYRSDWKMAFCKLFSYKEESNLRKPGQTILIVTGLAENIFIFQNVLSRLFKVGVCVMTHSLLFWYIERHGCVKIKQLKGVLFSEGNILWYVACFLKLNSLITPNSLILLLGVIDSLHLNIGEKSNFQKS